MEVKDWKRVSIKARVTKTSWINHLTQGDKMQHNTPHAFVSVSHVRRTRERRVLLQRKLQMMEATDASEVMNQTWVLSPAWTFREEAQLLTGAASPLPQFHLRSAADPPSVIQDINKGCRAKGSQRPESLLHGAETLNLEAFRKLSVWRSKIKMFLTLRMFWRRTCCTSCQQSRQESVILQSQ